MKVRICRSCGHENPVVSEAVTYCRYCASAKLDPVTDINDSAVKGGTNSKLKWIILVTLLLIVLGGAWWALQFSSKDEPLQPKKAPIPLAETLNKPENSAILKPQIVTKQVLPQKAEPVIEKPPENPTVVVVESVVNTPSKSPPSSKKAVDNPIVIAKKQIAENSVVIAEKQIEESRVQPKPVAEKKVQKVEVKKPVQKAVKQQKPEKEAENEATVALQLKLEQEKVKTLQEILAKKQTKEARRNMRVLDRANGVVTDTKTGLMWMACSIGQEWSGGYCNGEPEEYFWSEAVNLANEKTYANYSDWRAPTRDELDSIVDCTNDRVPYQLNGKGELITKDGVLQNGKCLGSFQKPTIDQRVFPNTASDFYWSYTFNTHTNYSAWGIVFNAGNHYNYNTSNVGLVRLVRKSQ